MARTVRTVRIRWHGATSDFGLSMTWFGSWLIGAEGVEGDWFHSGRGAAETEHQAPPGATSVRLRFWPSEGLDPEYVDVPLAADAETQLIDTAALDLDRPGPHSRLPRERVG